MTSLFVVIEALRFICKYTDPLGVTRLVDSHTDGFSFEFSTSIGMRSCSLYEMPTDISFARLASSLRQKFMVLFGFVIWVQIYNKSLIIILEMKEK